jgi:hypothetical protein
MSIAVIMSVSQNCVNEQSTRAVYNILLNQGWDVHREIEPRWTGFNAKLRWAKKCSREFTNYTHLMLVDARDVVVLVNPDTMLKKFEQFAHKWVNVAEPNMWPGNAWPSADVFPESPTPYRFLNSGLYMFEREYAEHMWWDVWPEIPEVGDDQEYMNNRYIEGYPDAIKLDHYCEMFQCVAGSTWCSEFKFGDWHNTLTDTHPVAIHFNGGNKIADKKWRKLWHRE